ncbi:MAG: cytochrome C oxidase subunit IV family protein [Acidimicrobiia bacterium]
MTDSTDVVESPGGELVPAGDGALATTSGAEVVPAAFRDDSHPGPVQYVFIAVVLCILTALEVGLYYLEGDVNNNLLIAMLWVLAFVKFFLVCSWYMHMKMDPPFFRRVFVVGICLASFVYGVVLFTFAATILADR